VLALSGTVSDRDAGRLRLDRGLLRRPRGEGSRVRIQRNVWETAWLQSN
jgi:hypothetical protein